MDTSKLLYEDPLIHRVEHAEVVDSAFEGFELYIPPSAPEYENGIPMWDILGTDAQIVQMPLQSGRSVKCFSGALAYMSDGIQMEAQLGGFAKTFGRLAGGGSLFELTFTNNSERHGYIAFTPDYPGVIVPVDMKRAQKIFVNRDSFLCSTMPWGMEASEVSAAINPASSTAGLCCSGMDLLVQTIEHGEWAFLMAMGTIIVKNLRHGESILVEGDTLLCFESSVSLDAKSVGDSCASSCVVGCCGGVGLFYANLTGPGRVWFQSMSIDKMRKLFPPQTRGDQDNDGGDIGGGGNVAEIFGTGASLGHAGLDFLRSAEHLLD